MPDILLPAPVLLTPVPGRLACGHTVMWPDTRLCPPPGHLEYCATCRAYQVVERVGEET
jgi:hypothetical protein